MNHAPERKNVNDQSFSLILDKSVTLMILHYSVIFMYVLNTVHGCQLSTAVIVCDLCGVCVPHCTIYSGLCIVLCCLVHSKR